MAVGQTSENVPVSMKWWIRSWKSMNRKFPIWGAFLVTNWSLAFGLTNSTGKGACSLKWSFRSDRIRSQAWRHFNFRTGQNIWHCSQIWDISFHLNLIQTMFKKVWNNPVRITSPGWVPGQVHIALSTNPTNLTATEGQLTISTTDFCGQITIRVTECQLCQSLWL